MIDLTFNNGTVERFTLVLSQRDYTHLGQITNIGKMNFKANLNAADELSFEVFKELNGREERLWEDIYDLRLVWIRELNEYFEIDVESTDQVSVVKNVTAKSLCESELSQTGLHNIEINTAADIARPDYDPLYPTVFYRTLPVTPVSSPSGNPKQQGWCEKSGNTYNPTSDTTVKAGKTYYILGVNYNKIRTSSLLHRLLDKVPAYDIAHVDETLINLQRIFSISDTTLYDFMTGECAEQFNCLFQFDSATRTISVYDLNSTCHNNNCSYYLETSHRYRGMFNDRCPKCGSADISSFGEDTKVFVSTENLTDEVKFDTDVASLKNCFRLEAGDDNMTAAVINSNPNGTRYIYEFNAESKKDMPAELVTLIENYDDLYEEYNNTRNMNLNTSLISSFNTLCRKYNVDSTYHMGSDTWKQITTPVYGYKNLIPHYYNCIDFYSYLKSSMMPPVIIPETTVNNEMEKLRVAFNADNRIAFSIRPTMVATVESAIINVAKLYVNTGFVKVQVANTSSWSYSSSAATGTWNGTIRLTSFEDDTDYVDRYFNLVLTIAFDEFMDQKISKYIQRAKESAELYDVLKMPYSTSSQKTQFRNELKKYGAVRLQSFHDSLEAVLGILIESGQGIKEPKAELYDSFYTPYYQKLKDVETELNTRNSEIELVNGIQDINGNSTKKGVIQYIIDSITAVQAALNFKNYIYSHTNSYDLYNVYTTYVRESNYSNPNYISDDLNNTQLFENAGRFLEMAKTELHKSATYQHSITSNINNLVAIPEFRPLLNKFNIGNWIRIKEDETIYRLRLISYSIDFDNITSLNTEFSDVTITADGMNDVTSILKQASSMASSYGYTQQQAEQGSDVKTNYIDDWVANGLNSALIRINNNDDEDISIDNTGLLARSYDDILDDYGEKQLRLTHNVIAFTKDKWESVETALGEFDFEHHIFDSDGVNTTTNTIVEPMYGIVAKAMLAGWVTGTRMESSTIIASHIQNVGNSNYIDLGSNKTADKLKYFLKCGSKFSVDKDGNAILEGKITATYGKIGGWIIDPVSGAGTATYSAGALYYSTPGSASGMLLAPSGYTYSSAYAGAAANTNFRVMLGSGFGLDSSGNVYIKGKVTASSGQIGNWYIAASTDTAHGSGNLYYQPSDTSTYPFGGNYTALLAPAGFTITIPKSTRRFGYYNSSTTASTTKNFELGIGANFGVDRTGVLYAAGAVISGSGSFSGSLTATSGKIGNWTVVNPDEASTTDAYKNYGKGSLHYSSAYILSPLGTNLSGTNRYLMPGTTTRANIKVKFGSNFAIDTDGNVYISGTITASEGKIGPWTIDEDGLTNGSDSWVEPYQIACGQHGGTLVKMIGKKSGHSTGYLSVEVNEDPEEWVRVFKGHIERAGIDSDEKYVKWWNGSDERIKDNINPLSLQEAKLIVENTEPLTFTYKKHKKKIKYYGVTAQRMEKECETLGIDNPFVCYNEMRGDLKNVDYEQFIIPILRVVQEHQKNIDSLQQEIKRLKGEKNG